jgi:hypothetical protein
MYKFTEIGRQKGKYKGTKSTMCRGYKGEDVEFSVNLIITGLLSTEFEKLSANYRTIHRSL